MKGPPSLPTNWGNWSRVESCSGHFLGWLPGQGFARPLGTPGLRWAFAQGMPTRLVQGQGLGGGCWLSPPGEMSPRKMPRSTPGPFLPEYWPCWIDRAPTRNKIQKNQRSSWPAAAPALRCRVGRFPLIHEQEGVTLLLSRAFARKATRKRGREACGWGRESEAKSKRDQ